MVWTGTTLFLADRIALSMQEGVSVGKLKQTGYQAFSGSKKR
jgi:hypothetical protein